ncbi:hypothetical protein N8Z02_01235 [Pelagibacteraceae bacterium]|nr:hypothetical protein [Pelagibacteraceae bacterium]
MDKIKKTDHFYLIDGSGYIFRAYYALPPLTRKSDGLPVGAVSGFCSMLFKLLEDSKSNENLQKPTHFAVIFDAARKTFRNEIYSDYKANRSEAPDDLAPQFEYIRKSVVAFNLPSVDLPNYEADDLIATYVEQILAKGAKVTIVSSDKDLMQLYRKDVRIFDPMKNKFITPEDIVSKFGVGPEKVIDVQSLAGDSSDNVPGVPGIGVKTAAELINKYGTLEKLLDNAQEIKQNKRRETLIENKDKAIISKKLVTLMKDAPVERKIEEFHLKKIDKDKLYKFLREMEFNRLLSSVISVYGEPELGEIAKEIKPEKKHQSISKKNYHLIINEKEIDEWINEAEEAGELAIDTETSSLDVHQADLVGISFSQNANVDAFVISGRGELMLEILLTQMRREGFEMTVSPPKVLYQKDESGNRMEPIEEITVDVDEEFSSKIIDSMNRRKGKLLDLKDTGKDKKRLIFHAPTRGLMGYTSRFLTLTKGTGVINRIFHGYGKFEGEMDGRKNGALISMANGKAVAFAIFNLQARGEMFVTHNDPVYEGMIVGLAPKAGDMIINVMKGKQLTNMRTQGTDENVVLTPVRQMSIAEQLSMLNTDEALEITPKSLRLRKAILNPNDRKKNEKSSTPL